MAGSNAEERIRAKVVALLRHLYPDARIIHELDLQCGVRVDLAAVTPAEIILAEIKSERDTLTRLPRQAKAMHRLGVEFWVVVAREWAKAVRDVDVETRSALYGGVVMLEEPERLVPLWGVPGPKGRRDRRLQHNHQALLWLILAGEARAHAAPFGAKLRTYGPECRRLMHDHLTGLELRAAVCRSLRARHFARADDPILEA